MSTLYKTATQPLPPKKGPAWLPPEGPNLDLLYLGWGHRLYGDEQFPFRRHEGWLYVYLLEGSPYVNTHNSSLQVSPGDLMLIHPACSHQWNDEPGRPSKILTWLWRTPPATDVLSVPPGKWLVFRPGREVAKTLQSIHEDCRHEVQRLDEETPLALRSLKGALDVFLSRQLRISSSRTDTDIRFDLAIQWLCMHLDAPRPINQACDYLQISPATLNRLFRSKAGMSAKEFVHRQRMETAQRLLLDEKLPVKEVAYHLGYRYANDLSRAYRRFWKRGVIAPPRIASSPHDSKG
jgi:AraC-like DNA-binding protein